MQKRLEELKTYLMEINDLTNAAAVLTWDQMTYMPQGGGTARGRQLATLGRLAQERSSDPAIGRLLEELRPYEESLPFEHDDASLIRVARRDFERAVRIPPEFVSRYNHHISETYAQWAEARPADDFKKVRPCLEKTLDLSREWANFYPGYEHIADPLIEVLDPGMNAASIRKLFTDLRTAQVPIAQAILSQEPADDSCLRQAFPEPEQMEFGDRIVRSIGYDFQRGRIDKTQHPFTITFSVGDVRIATRIRPDHLGEILFSNIHEAGHALYEQGVDMKFDGLPLMGGTSAGVHESQSRLWENIVGRSRGFWEFFYPQLQRTFPKQLRHATLDTFCRAINKVERSLIRTDADEVTYNLHVMLRFEFELAMLEGSLAVKDLPEAWRSRCQADLGIAPSDDKDGVLQDVHWFMGVIGGVFQGYTLGNVMSAQFYAAALAEHPEIPGEIKQGKFNTLHEWLIENIYRHGRKFTAPELVRRITGGEITIEPYIRYLWSKFGELYQL